jgi:hypothetical protein
MVIENKLIHNTSLKKYQILKIQIINYQQFVKNNTIKDQQI